MIVKLLIEHHFELLSLTEGCRGSSEPTHVKMSNCWKSHAAAHIILSRESISRVLNRLNRCIGCFFVVHIQQSEAGPN